MRHLVIGLSVLFCVVASRPASASPIVNLDFSPVSLRATGSIDTSVQRAETFKSNVSGYLSWIDLLLLGGDRGDLMVDVSTVGAFGQPDSSGLLAEMILPASWLPSSQPGWFTVDFASLNLALTLGQTYAVVLRTESPTASFNWYGDYIPFPYASSWSRATCCGWSGYSELAFGLRTAVDAQPYVPPARVSEPPADVLLLSAALVAFVATASRRRAVLAVPRDRREV